MEFASACINRQVIRFSRLQDDLVPWWNKCLQERAFSRTPDANGIDFDSLYDELSHRASLFNKLILILIQIRIRSRIMHKCEL